MWRFWAALVLLLAAQNTVELTGPLNWSSPFGPEMPFYGERVIHVLVCMVFVLFIYFAFRPRSADRLVGFSIGWAALVPALIAAPEPDRHVYPWVMGWAQVAMLVQLLFWRHEFLVPRHRRLATIVTIVMAMCLILFVYAQAAWGLSVPPNSALYWLHGPWANLAPALLAILLMIWASWARTPASRGSSHV